MPLQPLVYVFQNTIILWLLSRKHIDTWKVYQHNLFSNSVLEGRCPPEFSSNPDQNTLTCVFLVILKTLISLLRCVWSGLELNFAGQRPCRTDFEKPCCRESQNLTPHRVWYATPPDSSLACIREHWVARSPYCMYKAWLDTAIPNVSNSAPQRPATISVHYNSSTM